MPFRPEHSLLRVEVPALHTIDTTSVENLFGMWSLFSKTSHAMQEGKRLENLSWRLWNREHVYNLSGPAKESLCAPQSAPALRRSCRSTNKLAMGSRPTKMPALSSSLDSASSSDDHLEMASTRNQQTPKTKREPQRHEPTESRMSRSQPKHLTPVDLEKIVTTITTTSTLEPIDLPMPASSPSAKDVPATKPQPLPTFDLSSSEEAHSSETQTPHASSSSHGTLLQSSTSTVDTTGSNDSESSHMANSEGSSSTEMSTHSIVRGFVPGGAPSSYRSQTNLAAAQPTPILKTSPSYRQAPPKRKGAMFTIGTSSGEEESSLESHMHRSVLSDGLMGRPSSHASSGSKKQTSFKDEVKIGQAAAARHSPVFESDDEDEDVSESAIEDDDDSSDWEDSDDASGPSSMTENGGMFQRVDSRPNLTSRRSLLTSLMHEPDRARALANAASRSTPAIRRSRTTTPNGPSVATSPEAGSQFLHPGKEIPRSKPIIMTTSNTHQQLALSPRTTRKNMLSTELTESLRKNLLWERQHKSTGNLAALKRRHTSTDVKNLRQQPEPAPVISHQNNGPNRYNNDYFHAGLGEYHAKGW